MLCLAISFARHSPPYTSRLIRGLKLSTSPRKLHSHLSISVKCLLLFYSPLLRIPANCNKLHFRHDLCNFFWLSQRTIRWAIYGQLLSNKLAARIAIILLVNTSWHCLNIYFSSSYKHCHNRYSTHTRMRSANKNKLIQQTEQNTITHTPRDVFFCLVIIDKGKKGNITFSKYMFS